MVARRKGVTDFSGLWEWATKVNETVLRVSAAMAASPAAVVFVGILLSFSLPEGKLTGAEANPPACPENKKILLSPLSELVVMCCLFHLLVGSE